MPSPTVVLLDQVIEDGRANAPVGLSDSEYFEYFSAEQYFKDFDLSDDELLAGRIGGGNDAGIDSLYTFANDLVVEEDTAYDDLNTGFSLDLYVFQAKRSEAFAEDVFTRLSSSLPELVNIGFDIDTSSLYSQALKDRVNIFRKMLRTTARKFPKVCVHVIYCSKGDTSGIHANVKTQGERLKSALLQAIPDASGEIEYYGARELLTLARREPTYTLELAYKDATVLPDSYIAIVLLKEYAKFLIDDKGRIRRTVFDANVRDFQGPTSVNKDIRDTLESEADTEFWWLNNGVTILCTEVTARGTVLTLQNPQIVNGLQTSVTISERSQADPDFINSEQRSILVKVIKTAEEDIRNQIIKATNNQNKLPSANLRATEAIHRDIEQYYAAHDWYYDRRKNYYRMQGKPNSKIVTIPYLAQAILACGLSEPNNARARPSSLLQEDKDYNRIFDRSMQPSGFLWYGKLQKQVDRLLRSSETEQAVKSNMRFHVSMLVGCALHAGRVYAPGQLSAHFDADIEDSAVEKQIDVVVKELEFYVKRSGQNVEQIAKGREFVDYLLDKHFPRG